MGRQNQWMLTGKERVNCPFCNFKDTNRILRDNNYFYTIVPQAPAMFGHLIIVSKRAGGAHATDITSPELSNEQLTAMISEAKFLATKIKNCLKFEKRHVEKVYVLTQCESPHFHFHLKPRFEGESKGDAFLFEKELEEARWMQNGNRSEGEADGRKRIERVESVLEEHRKMLRIKKWTRGNEERKRFINRIIKQVKPLLDA